MRALQLVVLGALRVRPHARDLRSNALILRGLHARREAAARRADLPFRNLLLRDAVLAERDADLLLD